MCDLLSLCKIKGFAALITKLGLNLSVIHALSTVSAPAWGWDHVLPGTHACISVEIKGALSIVPWLIYLQALAHY